MSYVIFDTPQELSDREVRERVGALAPHREV